ncbi:MAG: membrane protein insertion efficiency factor YidD [Candidatus Peregrinibacteria bacterium]|nr:membrane protein insertion efficiency factor YidD [Candidatus Peregrinibacteria bacterium]
MKKFKSILLSIWHLPRHIAALLVLAYQKTLSPDHGWLKRFYPYGYCRFTPTCSEYSKQSLLKHGLIWGSIKSFWRICRCNPWSKGGEDKP